MPRWLWSIWSCKVMFLTNPLLRTLTKVSRSSTPQVQGPLPTPSHPNYHRRLLRLWDFKRSELSKSRGWIINRNFIWKYKTFIQNVSYDRIAGSRISVSLILWIETILILELFWNFDCKIDLNEGNIVWFAQNTDYDLYLYFILKPCFL